MDKYNDKDDDILATTDIPLAAFLFALGHQILENTSRDRDQFNRVAFRFAKSPKLMADVFDYQNNSFVRVQDFYKGLTHIWASIKDKGGA